jgi:hypothetical protein
MIDKTLAFNFLLLGCFNNLRIGYRKIWIKSWADSSLHDIDIRV